jgi:hypothetical protein
MRPRREVSPVTLWLLRPFFRHCWTRDAWILRVVGDRRGPVLLRRQPAELSSGDRRAGQQGEAGHVEHDTRQVQ